MENFSKYKFGDGGTLLNAATGNAVNKIKGKESYCLYNNQGKRETISQSTVNSWYAENVTKRRKLTEDEVAKIYDWIGSVKSIAEIFNVLPSTVSKIKNNQTFTHITNPK